MDTGAAYTPAEVELLADSLLSSVMLVIAVSPQGEIGLVKEVAAFSVAARQMVEHGRTYRLIDELRLRLPSRMELVQSRYQESGMSEAQARRLALDQCRSAAQTLLSIADPQEAAYFKGALLWVCRQVAQAVREQGGFLGIGGRTLSDQETEALRQIAFALGLPASAALVDALPEAPQAELPGRLEGIFSAEEWQVVRLAPVWAASAVVAASPSGLIGIAQELAALGRLMQEAAMRQPPGSLISLLVEDLLHRREAFHADAQTPISDITSAEGDNVQRALAQCRSAVALVEQKLPFQEAQEFKRMLLDVAQGVAGAAGESGAGGERISMDEQLALEELRHITGVE